MASFVRSVAFVVCVGADTIVLTLFRGLFFGTNRCARTFFFSVRFLRMDAHWHGKEKGGTAISPGCAKGTPRMYPFFRVPSGVRCLSTGGADTANPGHPLFSTTDTYAKKE
nr:hypothetical protein [Pandoravirus massiliensis]